jgi:hypothetical protein
MLMVKSGLDPHMIIKLEDGLKSLFLVVLAKCLWHISYLMLNCGMVYTYTLLVIRC